MVEHFNPQIREYFRERNKSRFGDRWGVKESPVDSKPKTILEVGCGNDPIVASPYRNVYDNETYIGVDPAENWKDYAERAAEKAGRHEVFHYKAGGLESELPKLDEASIDEVVCRNLIGYPAFTEYGNNLASLQTLVVEIVRVLKDEGKFVVVEDLSPDVIGVIAGQGDFKNAINKLVSSVNSELQLESFSQDENDLKQFITEETMIDPNFFIAVFRKKKG